LEPADQQDAGQQDVDGRNKSGHDEEKILKLPVGLASPRSSFGQSERKQRNVPMSKIAPCLWFNGEAEEAANFYVSLLPDSRIDKVQRNTIDSVAGSAGSVLVVQFTLAGQEYMALNGNTQSKFTHAISFKIDCADQAEVDRLWEGLLSNGGSPVQCGWLTDRYGVSWQIVPSAMLKFLGGADRAGAQRAMQAMMKMVKLDIATLQKAYDGG
jgi:predicted 3-demethylubiquinone-9 3-methyltransferase (glyoxalase superfamily)